MQMAAGIPVSAVIQLVRMESGVNGFCSPRYVRKETVALLLADIHDFAYMVLIGDNAAPRFALLLKKNQLAHVQVADFDAEFCQRLPADTVTAICVLHKNLHSAAFQLAAQIVMKVFQFPTLLIK